MELKPELCWNDAKKTANDIIFNHSGQYLSDVETKVLQASWENQTYDDMAISYGYSAEYLNKDVGNKLWKKLSNALGERVTKKNFKEALKRSSGAWQSQSHDRHGSEPREIPLIATDLPFPEGAVALDSPLYLERSGAEALCYETVSKPGALIRIKAPRLMGKTSLLTRILAYATYHNCQAVYLDLGSIDRAILTDLDKFLRWLCCIVGRQLKLENRLHDYWDTEILGSNDNCTLYFEEYLLANINYAVVLGLDDIDRIFSYTAVIEDFLGMLRSWHEKAKVHDIWKKLRLAIAHSTEVYIPLDINQSPFNAGVPIELGEFDQTQIQALAHLHQLTWTDAQVENLTQMVGGHPYLVRLAMYEVSSAKITLEQLLHSASTEAGIYSAHLRRHLEALQQAPQLLQALQQVVTASNPVNLDSMQIYKLHSMGLVKRKDNDVMPWCNLYREYFCRVLA
ncbi:AAA-like domain-containing protein [Myxacorys almedinensis]|uniref:vWA-MoxR associated protein N-terminal HTH domain-containing protein n=1 Tax=Myxacorys almedinensis A TaxID=2690445 RepID=A0A8J7YYI1_9CYAN|nr:AAA-like domain-containing protein [Myxacorys almedinensis]NDJ16962.1 hypothetical protein [Myxacorys almedinensis A]